MISFDTEINKIKETNKVLLSFMDKIINTPIESKGKEKVELKESEMTNFQKLLKNRGEL